MHLRNKLHSFKIYLNESSNINLVYWRRINALIGFCNVMINNWCENDFSVFALQWMLQYFTFLLHLHGYSSKTLSWLACLWYRIKKNPTLKCFLYQSVISLCYHESKSTIFILVSLKNVISIELENSFQRTELSWQMITLPA